MDWGFSEATVQLVAGLPLAFSSSNLIKIRSSCHQAQFQTVCYVHAYPLSQSVRDNMQVAHGLPHLPEYHV
jgi:hypothetical protein